MSSEGGKRAIIAALLANVGIAITKFIAWALSGSSAMLAEGVHSLADSGNQLLLLLGGRKAKRAPDREHPFGYGRERYIYAFIVAIVLFSIGGLFSIWEGISKIRNPHTLEMWWLPLVVLAIAIVLESLSLRTAVRESRPHKGASSWLTFIKRSKSPELPVILLEDFAALVGLVFAFLGVGLTALTGNTFFDAAATILIGALLIAVAVIIGIETKSLLVGEGATADDVKKIQLALGDAKEINRIIHMKTLYLGPDELMVGAKVSLPASTTMGEVSVIINMAERRIREAVPAARVIYIEPDVWLDPDLPTPTTSSIVMLSSD
ncbi:cation diffusion facilitator family transporter [Leucobacter sp. BZR 635]|uniref:cation diffusion facilitator family transporter n=1 Tax=Leucobacter sp. BZR 635 TaxID=3378705 RepID=UPI003A8BCF33